MNKLFKAFVAKNTGQRVAVAPEPLCIAIEDRLFPNPSYQYSNIYDVCVTIGAKVAMPPDQSEDAKRRAWTLINHEIYGEFREDLHAIRAALYDRNVGTALDALEKLHDRMFKL